MIGFTGKYVSTTPFFLSETILSQNFPNGCFAQDDTSLLEHLLEQG